MAESKDEKSKLVKIKLLFPRPKPPQQKISRCVSIMIKPLRIFQFFVVLLLFTFTIYMIVMDPTPISTLACILLIVVSGVYVFILAVDLISQFAGNALHVIPMCVFSLIGLMFFGTAGILLIVYGYTQLVVQITAMVLCLLATLLFLLDITMIFAFWKTKCSVCKRCCYYEGAEYLPREDEEPHPLEREEAKIMKHDVTTSLSDIRVPDELKTIVTPDHSYRKVEYARRREYVDSPTCVPSLYNFSIAQIQTEPCETSVVESQTPSTIVKETPMQTFAKCEYCQQFMQTAVSPEEAARQYLQCPQWSYPAVVQFIRGAASMPCCPGCKCATGTVPQSQSRPLSSQRTKSVPTTQEPETSNTLTSEVTQQDSKFDATKFTTGIAQTVTRLTLASVYVKPNKIETPSHNSNFTPKQKVDTTEGKRDGDLTSQSDQELTEEVITMLDKGEESAMVEEMIVDEKERNEERKEESVEKVDDKIERIKGGGKERRIYQFTRASEKERISSPKGSPRHIVDTQIGNGCYNPENDPFRSATLVSPLVSSRTKPRTLLHLRSNRVDPIRDADISDQVLVPESSKALASTVVPKNERAENPNPIDHRMNDVCSRCKRQSFTSASTNYCNIIFKDKRERYFCEFCAPTDSKKITSRLEIADSKKLRCANCRLSLRVKTNIKLKSDACPKCGQSQRQTAASSPSSM